MRCARCGSPRTVSPPERFVPSTNAGAVVIPVVADATTFVPQLQEAQKDVAEEARIKIAKTVTPEDVIR